MSSQASNAMTPKILLFLVLTPLLFATNVVIGRYGVDHVGPWTLAFLRWSIAGLILLPFCAPLSTKTWQDMRQHGRIIFMLGALGMGICGGGYYLSLQYTSATNGALLYTPSPALVVVFEALIFGTALGWMRISGLLLCLLGVILITIKGDFLILKSLQLNVGDLGVLGAAIGWAIYSLLLRREEIRVLPTNTVFMGSILAGVITLVPFVIIETRISDPWPQTFNDWAAVLALAIFPSVLAFSTFQYCIKEVGAGKTSVFLYLMPIAAVSLSVIFLGETLAWYHLAGLVMVLGGVAVVSSGKRSTEVIKI